MCGICGIVSPVSVKQADLLRMLQALAHRGPDGEGVYTQGCAGLGSRRLSIIDLPGGKQPIGNEGGTIWIVSNGEIYNYQKLRRELEQRGHRFRTDSDTEVILHLYEDLGDQCVEQLQGMFAFAVWDATQEKLFLARDRLGQKPLYYAFDRANFLFASEPKAILAVHKQERELDLAAMHDYLSLRFIPSPRTIFRHIQKLPPAHTLVLQRGQVKIERYWELSFQNKLTLSGAEILESLGEILKETVASHLVSDVPVGAFLSGGLDSSIIVAILARDLQQNPQTFSIGVEEADFDELPFARQVAERYGTRHVEERVAANLFYSLPTMIWHLDEPSDPVAACMFQAARLAARDVKVVLGGDGGDENFAGFDRYLGGGYVRMYRRIPNFVRRSLINLFLSHIPDSFRYKSSTQKLRWLHQVATQPNLAEQYAEATFFFRFNQQAKRDLYGPGLRKQIGGINSASIITGPFTNGHADDPIDRMLYTDIMTRLPEHSLLLTDRMSMAHGLEARSPFLDHTLVEFLACVPSHIKIQNGRSKHLLRQFALDYLPESIVQRKKQGFMLPIAYWFRTDLFPILEKTLLNSHFIREGLFSKQAVERLLREHQSSRVDHHVRLWMLLNLELWHQLYIEQAGGEVVTGRLLAAI